MIHIGVLTLMKNQNDIIITGIPRSGTTLTCHLLNKLPGFVALHEPMHPSKLFGLTFDVIFKEIKSFFDAQRASLLKNGTALSKSASGAVPDNSVGNVDEQTGKRERVINGSTIVVTKPLGKNFQLAIKHPSMFTALIELVNMHFQCFAIIRNPLSVLLSWNSVTFPVSSGHARAAEGFDSRLADSLTNQANQYIRQLILLDWFFSKYRSTLTHQQVLKYEDIILSGGKALAVITERAKLLNERLISKNSSKLYKRDKIEYFADLLINYKGAYFEFYEKKDIINLL